MDTAYDLFLFLSLWGLWLCLANFYSYWLFSRDKQFARLGLRRIPERRLLQSAMMGGWIGAKLAQKHLRHKTVKEPFRTHLNLMVIGPVLICGFMLTLSWTMVNKDAPLAKRLASSLSLSGLSSLITSVNDQSPILDAPLSADETSMPRRFGRGADQPMTSKFIRP